MLISLCMMQRAEWIRKNGVGDSIRKLLKMAFLLNTVNLIWGDAQPREHCIESASPRGPLLRDHRSSSAAAGSLTSVSEAKRVQISVPSCPAMASAYAGAQPASPAAAGHHTPAAAAAGQQNHLLAFRVMRLSRPSLQPDRAAMLRFDPHDVFLPEDALTSPDPSAAADYLHRLLHPADATATVPGDFSFRDRFLLRDSADVLALPGLLVLPQSFGFASSSQFPFFWRVLYCDR
jgi:hypothetical protein